MNARRSVTTYVALGSNLGRREDHLKQAVRAFRDHEQITVTNESALYESPAMTTDPREDQPAYLNAVVELETTMSAQELLDLCRRLERTAGRRRQSGERWKSRTLDLDILLFGREVIDQPGLSVPHPRMAERRFVLRPLADIAPDVRLPEPIGATVRQLLAVCPDENEPVRRASSVSGS